MASGPAGLFERSNQMKLRSPITAGVALCGAALAFGVVVFRAQADEWDKKTVLTVDQPVQITNTYLEPGTYVLKLANSSSDRHIVQIFNADQSHIINTVLAIPNYRVQPTGNSRFTFWETPPGSAKALRAWFYPGDSFGQEFRYPKQLRQLASLTTTERAPAFAPTPAPAPAPAPAPEPAPVPQPQAVNQEPIREQPPVEVAQNTPPPPPAAQVQPPPPAAAPSEPQELPKTATTYPAIGLAGLFSLGLYGLIRRKDSA
jgi:outer membrane biosynthesis protein TonB